MAQPAKFGKYEVVGKIGVGGFGEVYKGRDPYIKRLVAIKTCTSDEDQVRSRFFREAEIAGNLHHRHITTIYDFGEEGELPYLVQEFLTGEDLDCVIERHEPIPLGQKLRYLLQVARGLEYAESQGVVHRDIKPANIRILADGTAKIMDFGIAKLLHQESGLTRTGMTVGTAAYLAPEQVKGEAVDSRTDIFAFGVLAYELVTGVRPFQGQTFSSVLYQILTDEPEPVPELCASCPPKMTRLVERCMEKDPANRYPSFSDLVPVLAELTREHPIETEIQPTAEIPARQVASAAARRAASEAETPEVSPQETGPEIDQTVVTDLPLRKTDPDLTVQLDTRPMRSQEATLEQPIEGIEPASAAAERPKRRPALWIAAVGVLILAGVGIGWYALSADRAPSTDEAYTAAPPAETEPAPPEAPNSPAGGELAVETADAAADAEPAAVSGLADVPPPPPKPSTIIADTSWSDEIQVALDGGSPRPLTRQRSWEIQPGRHTLVFSLETLEYSARESVEVDIGEGSIQRVESPIPEPGGLTVQAFPGSPQGAVRIGGEEAGPTPLARKLAPGTYSIEVVGPDGSDLAPVAREITVSSGGQAILTFDLTGRRDPVVLEQEREEP